MGQSLSSPNCPMKWETIGDRQGHEMDRISKRSLWACISLLSPLHPPSLKVERVEQGVQRKEEMTKFENYFAICGICCVDFFFFFYGAGKVVFSGVHAKQLQGLSSKLSLCWKITTLHDRSSSLSTLFFTFLAPAGSSFTLKRKPANAIYQYQLQAPIWSD